MSKPKENEIIQKSESKKIKWPPGSFKNKAKKWNQ